MEMSSGFFISNEQNLLHNCAFNHVKAVKIRTIESVLLIVQGGKEVPH